MQHTIGGFPANTGREQLLPGMPQSSNWLAQTEGGSFSWLFGVCPRTIRLFGEKNKMFGERLVSKAATAVTRWHRRLPEAMEDQADKEDNE